MSFLPLLIILRRDSDEDDVDDVESSLSTGAIAGIAVGAVVVLVTIIALCWCKRRRSRRHKNKIRGLDDEEKPLPVNRTAAAPASSDEGSTGMRADNPKQQMKEPIAPAPAYSRLQNKDSSYNALTGERETELDGGTKAINEIGSSRKGTEQRLSENGRHELDSSEENKQLENSHPGRELAHEMPVDNVQKGDATQSYSEMDGRDYVSTEHGRLDSEAISELPGSGVSRTTMMGTIMTGGTVSSSSTKK